MERNHRPDADVLIGVFDQRGREPAVNAAGPPEAGAEVIRFAPYLRARRGRATAPPANRA